jgi:hypothetical protein
LEEPEEECVSDCVDSPTTYPSCAAELEAFVPCAAEATYVCDDEGDAVTQSCGDERDALRACFAASTEE